MFFFQAEDGIRDLVRSRGLGDVYKRQVLTAAGKKVVAVRHPMPYGDLVKQKVQRFATYADLKKHKCTIEEIEEYEPHVARGGVISVSYTHLTLPTSDLV